MKRLRPQAATVIYDSKMKYASIAQVAERILGKDEVSSSNLLRSSTFFTHCQTASEGKCKK